MEAGLRKFAPIENFLLYSIGQHLLGMRWFQLLSAGGQGLAMMDCNSTSGLVIAALLSARLLILQSVFLVGGMWSGWRDVAPTSVPLRNAIKGVACVQTSIPFWKRLREPVYKKLCTFT